MKAFTLLFKVGPAGLFGLPEEGVTVMPGRAGTFTGPVLDSRSGQFVSHGHLPEYRPDEEAVRFTGSLGDCPLSVQDNFFRLQIQATDMQAALGKGTSAFEHLLRLLALHYGNWFSYEIVQIEAADGEMQVHPGPRAFALAHVTAYNTKALSENIAASASWSRVDDPRLTRALQYKEHAAVLFERRGGFGFFSPHFAFLLTSAYLNLWKAITIVLGEPGVDNDYQSRFLKFGLPKGYWQERVKPLQDVRNAFDVAHYSLRRDDIQRVENAFGVAGAVSREVIRAYVGYLETLPNRPLQPTSGELSE